MHSNHARSQCSIWPRFLMSCLMCVPLVCRAARLCHSAAHGGQILAPLELVQQLVKTWSGNDLDLQAHHKPAKAAKAHAEQGE